MLYKRNKNLPAYLTNNDEKKLTDIAYAVLVYINSCQRIEKRITNKSGGSWANNSMYGLNKLNSNHMIKETGMTQLDIWQIGLNTSSTCKLTISDAWMEYRTPPLQSACHARSVFIKALAKICVAVVGNFGKRSLC